MECVSNRATAEKVAVFRELFTGLDNVYGTYDPGSGRVTQVKAPVTDKVLLDHLIGRQPYGVYLLVKDKTRAVAADFDSENRQAPAEFVARAKHYRISVYIERSKSKGYHAWIFFEDRGVLSCKARLVARHILNDVEQPGVEVFPKHDVLDTTVFYGNFINAPLFGTLVSQGKTVFVDPVSFDPYPDQWALLESVEKVSEAALDDIIEVNDLSQQVSFERPSPDSTGGERRKFGIPPCAQKMLEGGVSEFQRVSCFRLAVTLKRVGLPFDIAIAALKEWAQKNQPVNGKGVIRESEIVSQASCAYRNCYAGFGCESEAVKPFCDPSCPVGQWREQRKNSAGE